MTGEFLFYCKMGLNANAMVGFEAKNGSRRSTQIDTDFGGENPSPVG
jgi:hypothetical protein